MLSTPGGSLNMEEINKIQTCCQYPQWARLGPPMWIIYHFLVPFPSLKDHQNQAQNRANPCSAQNVSSTTPPTPNRGIHCPKHPRNWSDFVLKSDLESSCQQNIGFPSFQTQGKDIVAPNAPNGDLWRVQKTIANNYLPLYLIDYGMQNKAEQMKNIEVRRFRVMRSQYIYIYIHVYSFHSFIIWICCFGYLVCVVLRCSPGHLLREPVLEQ